MEAELKLRSFSIRVATLTGREVAVEQVRKKALKITVHAEMLQSAFSNDDSGNSSIREEQISTY